MNAVPNNLRKTLFYLAVFGVVLFIHLSLVGYAADDAYIHMRISENLAEHGVPYFNVNEPVMGSSTTLFNVSLAILFYFFGVTAYPVAVFNSVMVTLNAAVWSGICKTILQDQRFRVDLLASALIVATTLEAGVDLMDSPMDLVVLGLGILQYFRGKPSSFFFLSVAVFCRIEFAVFFLAFLGHCLWRRTLPFMKILAFGFAGGMPWIAYDLYFFGTLVPQPITAKSIVYQLTPLEFFYIAVRHLYGPHLTYALREIMIVHLIGMIPFLLFGLWLTRKQAAPGMTEPALLVGGPGLAIFGAYVFKRALLFQWYIPLFLLPIFTALFVTAQSRPGRVLKAAVLFLVSPVLFNFAVNVAAAVGRTEWYSDFIYGARAARYLEVAEHLYRQYPKANMMASEVGGLGFAFKGEIYDGCCLISKRGMKYHPISGEEMRWSGAMGGGTIPAEFARAVRPDLIVSYEVFLGKIPGASWLEAEYVRHVLPPLRAKDMAVADPRHFFFGKNLIVYVRKDLAKGPIGLE